MDYGVIYMLFNKINNKVYIGQTINFKERMSAHKIIKRKDKIHNSIQKYGWDNFDKLILDSAKNEKNLNCLEQYYINLYNSVEFGYNLTYGGESGQKSKETKEKMSKSQIGKPKSEEQKQKMSMAKIGKLNHNFGKPRVIGAGCPSKLIKCIETNKIFESIRCCAREMNLDQRNISSHLKGKVKTVGGFTFKLAEI